LIEIVPDFLRMASISGPVWADIWSVKPFGHEAPEAGPT
jgi:hypothetical protein